MRQAARAAELPVADKPESMEICFVPDGDHAAFVAARAAVPPGDVVTREGKRLGGHAGLHRFTVGQKKGVPGGAGTVLRLEAGTGTVVVGPEDAAWSDRARVGQVRWIGPPPAGPLRALVQVRHRHPPALAAVRPDGADADVRFASRVRAISPGQAAVFYDGDRVLGGGWIQ